MLTELANSFPGQRHWNKSTDISTKDVNKRKNGVQQKPSVKRDNNSIRKVPITRWNV